MVLVALSVISRWKRVAALLRHDLVLIADPALELAFDLVLALLDTHDWVVETQDGGRASREFTCSRCRKRCRTTFVAPRFGDLERADIHVDCELASKDVRDVMES